VTVDSRAIPYSLLLKAVLLDWAELSGDSEREKKLPIIFFSQILDFFSKFSFKKIQKL
jgi:hypothetical protein